MKDRNERIAMFKETIAELKAQRKQMASELKLIDDELAIYGHVSKALIPKQPTQKRKKSGRPVKELILTALEDSDSPLSVSDIAEKTFSEYKGKQDINGFKASISTALFNMRKSDQVSQPERGVWERTTEVIAEVV